MASSHYIKVMMDGIFRHENFRNEIIWQRSTGKSLMTKIPNSHDVILAYRHPIKPRGTTMLSSRRMTIATFRKKT